MTTPQPSTAPTIRTIDKNAAEAQSADLVQANIERLRSLFPDAFTEGRIDFEVLKSLLGGEVDEREEKYGLNWHGKRRARQLALTPSTGTLRPCPEESVDWDTTQNLMIEGDNLEVLKLLQKSYAGKVKLIYIDPPYNTGKDFVYPDNFQDSIKNYLKLTGQVEGGQKISSNTEASGRFHTDWLNMMYPRLKIARSMLRDDGLLMVSIDEREIGNLRLMLDEIFGPENNVCEFIWQAKRGGGSDNSGVVSDHEYIVCYCRDFESQPLRQVLIDAEPLDSVDDAGPFRRGRELNKWGANSLRKDRPTMYFPIPGPAGVDVYPIRNDDKEGCWCWGKPKMLGAVAAGNVEFVGRENGTYVAYEKVRSTEGRGKPHRTILEDCGQTADGTKSIKELFDGERVFDFSKPPSLVAKLLAIGTAAADSEGVSEPQIVVDFFAGSGSTGHAVLEQNLVEDANRRFLLVQLPEPLDGANKDQKIAADFCDTLCKPRTIAELTKERLRRAAKKLQSENPMFANDLGFRVFRLAASNIRAWNPNPDDLQTTVEEHTEHVLPDRSEQDLLYELLLKLGLDLAVPIETRQIAGKTVHNIGAGALMVCLSDGIDRDVAEPLALGIAEWQKAQAEALQVGGDDKNQAVGTKLVFKDSAFADDVAKTNLAAILSQHGLDDVRSI